MQKQKQSLFADKFRLLNSQENADEINWSSSESSDFENVSNGGRFCNVTKLRNSKRKRKVKVLKNVSNLDTTVFDATKSHKEVSCEDKCPSPAENSIRRSRGNSPVLGVTPLFFPPYKCSKITQKSPILTSKRCHQQPKPDMSIKSPILTLKYASPKISSKVKKNLFKSKNPQELDAENNHASVLLNNKNDFKHLLRRKSNLCDNNYKYNLSKNHLDELKINNNYSVSNKTYEKAMELPLVQDNERKEESELQDKTEDSTLDDSYDNLRTTSLDLVTKIRSYFDSHFNSESNSQKSISISDSLTPKHSSKSSDDIEIIASITQVKSCKLSSQLEAELASKDISPASSGSAEINLEKSKKIRYKKNGLAYRLRALLKKQTANISLWQHERFLAENSNFVIPKGENVVFRIQNVDFKYGCYLLKAVNVDDEEFLILINSINVGNIQFATDAIFKLYVPYKIHDFDTNCKLIVNVNKFECLLIKNNES